MYVYNKGANLNGYHMKSPLSHELWRPLAESWKMNSDASWSEEFGVGGIGWIICDFFGSLIGRGCLRIGKHWKIKVLEMKTIEEGLKAFHSRSLYEIDSDLLDIKSVVCSVLKLA